MKRHRVAEKVGRLYLFHYCRVAVRVWYVLEVWEFKKSSPSPETKSFSLWSYINFKDLTPPKGPGTVL